MPGNAISGLNSDRNEELRLRDFISSSAEEENTSPSPGINVSVRKLSVHGSLKEVPKPAKIDDFLNDYDDESSSRFTILKTKEFSTGLENPYSSRDFNNKSKPNTAASQAIMPQSYRNGVAKCAPINSQITRSGMIKELKKKKE
jgi:hypothetical protein